MTTQKGFLLQPSVELVSMGYPPKASALRVGCGRKKCKLLSRNSARNTGELVRRGRCFMPDLIILEGQVVGKVIFSFMRDVWWAQVLLHTKTCPLQSPVVGPSYKRHTHCWECYPCVPPASSRFSPASQLTAGREISYRFLYCISWS